MEFYSVNAPDPYLVRVEEEIIDAGKFLDVNVVTEAIAKEWSFMWEYFHPSALFMTWLEARQYRKFNAEYFGNNIDLEFVKNRREHQRVDKDLTWRTVERMLPPSIVLPVRGEAVIVPTSGREDQWEIDLREFYTSFHAGGSREGQLADPHLLEPYVVTRGVVVLMLFQGKAPLPYFDINRGPNDGGWAMYRIACEIGPGMVRLLTWAGGRGWFPGMHANLAGRVDAMPTKMVDHDAAYHYRRQLGFQETGDFPKTSGGITTGTVHHFVRRPPMPPRTSQRVVGVNEVPEELVNDNERAIWAPIIRTRGQDAAVAEIQRLRTIQFKEQEAAFWQLEKIEKQWEKMSLRIVSDRLGVGKV
jgi:hypothetical protein